VGVVGCHHKVGELTQQAGPSAHSEHLLARSYPFFRRRAEY
jgi:hypothetical protein